MSTESNQQSSIYNLQSRRAPSPQPLPLVDLAIVGGGPAGTAAALEACRRGLRVAIWERDRFPRDKVCGEFLSAESIPLLEEEIPAALARGALITRADFVSRRGRVHTFSLPFPARGLSRRVLDEALWKAAAASGAQIREGEAIRRLRKPEPSPRQDASWAIESANGTVQKARKLLVACGRWWTIEGFRSPARNWGKGRVGRWLGVKAHFRGLPPRHAVEMYFFPGGYCGLAPIEDGLYNVCCLMHRSLARDLGTGCLSDFAAWLTLLARHPPLEARLRGATQTSKTIATAPVRLARWCADDDGALLAGDAAGFLDPFTGDGISMALHGGRLAAEALAGTWSEKTPQAAAERIVRQYRHRLGRAVRRSYLIAGLVRLLVRAPAGVQASAATAVLPSLGTRLLAETRWRVKSSQE